jgi:aspartyl-tRNA(Asn)/glutamyl-tRNA(Gln) amidotransferase subunit A
MYQKSLTELLQLLESKNVSSVELTTHLLDRIDTLDPKINSYITVCRESALVQAKKADAARAAGTGGPLAGIPIAQKDIFCTQGTRTSCASKMLDSFVSPYDAHTVEAFNRAGCVMLGKTNMDEFAMGSSNENSFYGSVKNPWNLDYIPGGSSGGSSAAVAARLAPIATGTDTGGSIRQPAAHCGITGLKPTYGRVSRYGMVAFASSMDQGGLMAASAEDIAQLLPVMAGHDPRDSTCSPEPVPNYSKHLNDSLSGLKIGLPKEYFSDELPEPMHQKMKVVIDELKNLGATFRSISLPHTHLASATYYVLAPAECSANLSRFDGVRFGHRSSSYSNLQELYEKSRSEAFGYEVKRRILTGTYVLSAGYYDAYYRKAQQVRRLMRQDFLDAFKEVDCIFSPVTPTPAFKLGEKTNDPIAMYLSDIYTIACNLAGLPGLSMPAGFIDGMPVGAQLIGPHFSEARLLNVAHQYQQKTDWHQQIPDIAHID